jgi:hypothetical protein
MVARDQLYEVPPLTGCIRSEAARRMRSRTVAR